MTSPPDLYETTRSSLETVLDTVPAAGWDAASPCDGWTARDVLRHVVETQRDFFSTHGIDLGPAADLGPEPAAAWRDHAKRVGEVLSDDALAGRPYDGHFGPTTVGATFEQFYLFDMVVHRWDIARATGQDTGFSEAELDRLEAGADSFGPALYMDGICRPGVEAPADADRATRLLARLGRRP